jgi:murein DD-endopeptidase MepM/ murein hydrolase activator NlpD
MACRTVASAVSLVLALASQLSVTGYTDAAPALLKIAGPMGAVSPGDVVLLTVSASRALVALEGTAFNRRVELWSSGGKEWHGFLPVALDTVPGTYGVVVRAVGDDGLNAAGQLSLTVQPKSFETRELRLARQFTDPPATEMARIADEANLLANIFEASRPERLWRGTFVRPVPGVSTSSFGRLTLLNGQAGSRHQGTDFRAAVGTAVQAPNAGEVLFAGDLYYSGTTVVLDHGLGLYSLFAHLSRVTVAVGDRVAPGDLLGQSGATGRVTGPHLHWAVRLRNVSVDPLSLMETSVGLNESHTLTASP